MNDTILTLIELENRLSERIGQIFRDTGVINGDLVKRLEKIKACIWDSLEV